MDPAQLSPTTPLQNKTNSPAKKPMSDRERILYRIKQLAPWRMSVQITDDISTGDHLNLNAGRDSQCHKSRADARKQFHRLMNRIYPSGLKHKRLLDVGCGAGGYCFWARELKSELAYGLDVREHWIKQAKFLRFNRTVGIRNRTQFEILNLYDLPNETFWPIEMGALEIGTASK